MTGTQPSAVMSTGRVAGLDVFVDWMIDNASGHRGSRSTLMQLRSAWRSVRRELDLDPQAKVSELDPDELMDHFCQRRGEQFRSDAIYRTRLRRALEAYRAWLAALETGELNWWPLQPPAVRTPRTDAGESTRLLRFPLRPGMNIRLELPRDLTADEAKLLGTWLLQHATN